MFGSDIYSLMNRSTIIIIITTTTTTITTTITTINTTTTTTTSTTTTTTTTTTKMTYTATCNNTNKMINYIISCKNIVIRTDMCFSVCLNFLWTQWSTSFTGSVGQVAPLFRKLSNSLCIHELPALKLSCAQPLQAKQRFLTPFSVICFNIILTTTPRSRRIVLSWRRFDLNVCLSSHPCVLSCPAHLFSQKMYTRMVLVKSANYWLFLLCDSPFPV